MYQIQITIMNDMEDKINALIFLLKEELKIRNMARLAGENNSVIFIRGNKKQITYLMQRLSNIGVGVDFGIIDILPITATIPEKVIENQEFEEDTEEKIRSRISLEEIKNYIKEVATIDFHFYLFILLAAFIAAVGLINNSPAIIIASMLLSPLMGPILGVSYGIVTKDKKIIKNGLNGQLNSIILILSIGILMGFLTYIILPDFQPTKEMLSRNYPNLFDIILALCGGIAVGFCVTASIRSSLVGISIAVSLLPPIVNTGIAISLGEWSFALGSLMLMLTNVLIINVASVAVFKLKEIEAVPLTDHDWKGPEEWIKFKKEKVVAIAPVEEVPKSTCQTFRNFFKRKPEETSKNIPKSNQDAESK